MLSGKHVAEIHLATVEADPAAVGHRNGLIVKRVGQVLQATIDAADRVSRAAGTFIPSAWCGRSWLN
jgi:hypothetical protein